MVENAEDLSFNDKEFQFSKEVRKLWIKYSGDNVILDNSQKLFLNIPSEVKSKMLDYYQRTLIEFIESEKLLKKCCEIKDIYISNIDNVNNTSSYVKMTSDIIINMDKVNKYIFSIVKLHIDNISFRKNYISWINGTTNIENEFIDRWILIRDIRNKFEHPDDLETTFFSRTQSGVVFPEIEHNGKYYDLLELSENSLLCICLFFKGIIGAALLHSKYLVMFTDELGNIFNK